VEDDVAVGATGAADAETMREGGGVGVSSDEEQAVVAADDAAVQAGGQVSDAYSTTGEVPSVSQGEFHAEPGLMADMPPPHEDEVRRDEAGGGRLSPGAAVAAEAAGEGQEAEDSGRDGLPESTVVDESDIIDDLEHMDEEDVAVEDFGDDGDVGDATGDAGDATGDVLDHIEMGEIYDGSDTQADVGSDTGDDMVAIGEVGDLLHEAVDRRDREAVGSQQTEVGVLGFGEVGADGEAVVEGVESSKPVPAAPGGDEAYTSSALSFSQDPDHTTDLTQLNSATPVKRPRSGMPKRGLFQNKRALYCPDRDVLTFFAGLSLPRALGLPCPGLAAVTR